MVLTDIILLVLLGLIIMRALVDRDFKAAHTPLDFPLLAFLGIALLSTGVAIIQSRVTINYSLGQVRSIISYLYFFTVTNLVRQEKQLHSLLKGMFFLAIIVALAMIAQFILGDSVRILPGRVETLDTEGVDFTGITRIIPPGESLIFPAFLALTTILMIKKMGFKNAPELIGWVLTGLAVILTFKRNLWIVSFLAFFLLSFFSSWKIRLKMAGAGLLVISLTFIILTILPILSQNGSEANKLIDGVFYRLGSLADIRTFDDPNSSLNWRDFEYQYALPQIALHPFTGIGLGTTYRPSVIGRDPVVSRGSTFIHNGHLDIIVKSGVLGYISYLLFAFIALARGYKFWRIVPIQFQAVFIGFTLAYLGILIGSIVSPMIVTAWWTPVIGVMIGINEVVLAKSLTKKIDSVTL